MINELIFIINHLYLELWPLTVFIIEYPKLNTTNKKNGIVNKLIITPINTKSIGYK